MTSTELWDEEQLQLWLEQALVSAPAYLGDAIRLAVANYKDIVEQGGADGYDRQVLELTVRILRHHTSLASLRRAKDRVTSDLDAAIKACQLLEWKAGMIGEQAGLTEAGAAYKMFHTKRKKKK